MSAMMRRMSMGQNGVGAFVDSVLPFTFVVIPARNVANHIGTTLRYLSELGFSAEQVHVVVNGSTDDTADAARAGGFAIVHDRDRVLDSVRDVLNPLIGEYGVSREWFRTSGKGLALFAGLIALSKLDPRPNNLVIFLDAEITNIGAVDPVSCLLAGWNAWQGQVELVKLASDGRCDREIQLFLATHPEYHGLAAMEWPLCGQSVASWKTLRRMRFASHYAVEMAILMQLWDQHRTPTVFGDVRAQTALHDESKSDEHYARMHVRIMGFVRRFAGITHLTPEQIARLNRAVVMEGPQNDIVLPSIEHLLATRRR